MPFDSYTSLQTAVAAHLNRAGDSIILGAIPDLIALFETQVTTDPRYRVREMAVRSTATITGQYLALPVSPDAFLGMRSIRLTSTNPVAVLDPDTDDNFWRTFAQSDAGTPRVFTVIGEEIAFGPAPNGTYTVEMWFYQFDALSVANQTNWLLTKYPAIYLYGTLCEADPYLGNDDRLPVWKAKLEELVGNLDLSSRRARHGGGALVQRVLTPVP